MRHILDRPVWSALETRHAALSHGGEMARRYRSPISTFATTRDDSPECLRGLQELAEPGETLLLAQADEIIAPPRFAVVSRAAAVQMVAERPMAAASDDRIERLGEADAAAMLDLALLTRPGPFTLKALSFGDFWGVKIDGVLVAMAGERMKQPGHTELSGVCAHPDFRGKGFGRLLSLFVAGQIVERGDLPYLHAYASNEGAIALYESIGFRLRCPMNVAVIARA